MQLYEINYGPAIAALILGSICGLLNAVANYREQQLNPQRSPAQRRAMREDCRSKGL